MKNPGIYPTLTGKRLLRDMYEGEDMDVDRTEIILCLVIMPSHDEVGQMTDEQRRHVANWAFREHLSASDNMTLRIKKPDWLNIDDRCK